MLIGDAIAAGHLFGKGAGVGGDHPAPAGIGPRQRAAGATHLPQEAEFFRFAIGQHHHMVCLDRRRDLRRGQVQLPVHHILKMQGADLLAQAIKVVAGGVKGHFRRGATGQGQAYLASALRVGGQ